MIERLQPYDRRYGGHELALFYMNAIDIADKHKLLTLAVAVAEQVFINNFIPPQARSMRHKTMFTIHSEARLVHNAMIATFAIKPPIPEMQVDFKFTPEIEFGQMNGFPAHCFVVPSLKTMLASLDIVIKRFKRFF